ncbi:hypothetical protein OUZ56_012975 [Daphnia magna]|uniref:Uncharacterized protein n=1 Tax=Daphnia magna TaxID=35525 RepID=A0ABQ9Z4J4_9CRUS|nr:hypothetical protein OUZ56_012975 [Daphnia magna]
MLESCVMHQDFERGRVDGVMDTTGQGWLPVNVYVVVNGLGVAFLNMMLEIGVRFQMRKIIFPAYANEEYYKDTKCSAIPYRESNTEFSRRN